MGARVISKRKNDATGIMHILYIALVKRARSAITTQSAGMFGARVQSRTGVFTMVRHARSAIIKYMASVQKGRLRSNTRSTAWFSTARDYNKNARR